MGNKTRVNEVKDWNFDASTFEVLNFINKSKTKQKVSLNTHFLFNPSFTFYELTGKTPYLSLKPYNKEIDTNTDADYYYAFSSYYKILSSRFKVVYKVNDERWLMMNRNLEPQARDVEKIAYLNFFDNPLTDAPDSNYKQDEKGNSFYILKDAFSPGLYSKYNMITDAEINVISASVKVSPLEKVSKGIFLIIARSQGDKVIDYLMSDDRSETFPLQPNHWSTLTLSGALVGNDTNDYLKVYLWNPDGKTIRLDDMVVKIKKN
jgi:hypothetical protein